MDALYVWDKSIFDGIRCLMPGFFPTNVWHSISLFHRDSDGAKKNEPVIDWLDVTVGRVENTVHLYTCTLVHLYTCTCVHMYTCTRVHLYTWVYLG